MEVYFDNSATTKCYEGVKNIVCKLMTEDYGNPSSLHTKGLIAEKYIKEAKEIIASNLKVKAKEIIFTSGGTEGDNLAVIGSVMANKRRGMHIITTCFEHPAVNSSMAYLEEQGFRITYLPVNKYGLIDLEELKNAVCEDTILVSIMHTNNEIGAVQPIDEIGRFLKKIDKNIIFHVDAIQGFGKYRIYPGRAGIDLLTVSGHKIHGPKGTGFLYINEKVKVAPVIFGGGQQNAIRSGTENVPGIAGIGRAVKEIYDNFEQKLDLLYNLKQEFIKGIMEIDGICINGYTDHRSAPHIVSVSVENVRSEVLLHALEERGIYVSAGSACSSRKPQVSRTLKAIGLNKDLLESTVRFSFSFETTKDEIDYGITVLKEILPLLRRFKRK